MKFLYSHRTQAGDGQWVHISALTGALAARGHDIEMSGPGGETARMLSAGDNRRSLKSYLPAPFYEAAEFGYSLPAFARLSAQAKRAQPDVLYERYNLFYHAGAWLRQRHGVPLILEVNAPLAHERAAHGDLAFKNLAKKSEAAIWRAADKVLPVTNVLADYVRAAGVPEEKIEVIQNGVGEEFLSLVDPAPVREQYGLENKLVLGFAGFVRDWHGVDQAIRFLAESARRDLYLLIVGDGPARAALETLAGELGVQDRVSITGILQRGAMPAHVAAFDIALQPAVVDYASPLKLFEYMAQAKPVIAPDAANIREVIGDGEDGVLFGSGEFANSLEALVSDADLRARLGAAARETLVRRDFTWAGNARRVERIAQQLKEGRS